MMKTLAIDASTKATGIAIFEDTKLVHYECLYETSSEVLVRIKNMAKRIGEIYEEFKPNHIVMEEVLPNDVHNNQSVYKALMYLQGAIALELYNLHRHIKINEFTVASHWRKNCGIHTGRNVKRDQLKENSKDYVYKNYGIHVTDDIADAICLGVSYIGENRSAF